MYNNLPVGMPGIYKLSDAKTRMVSAENVYGQKGGGGMADSNSPVQAEVEQIGQDWSIDENCPARELGQGWKVRPYINIPANSTATIMDVKGAGIIQHIWITTYPDHFRDIILRVFWDDSKVPSVEVPLGDFFCNATGFAQINAIPINVNSDNAMNCYFPMPFRKRAKITLENRRPELQKHIFYSITYAEASVEDDAAYFHAQFNRSNPSEKGKDYIIVENISGKGHYVGTYMMWQQNSNGWWGEGEIKFFIDGDEEFPTICGTGTEDYFGGAWCFNKGGTYSGPYLGYPVGVTGGGKAGDRHGLYRFHVMDPIRFDKDLRVTIQALGWRKDNSFLQLQDDIASVAYWYQTLPHNAFPELPGRDQLEII